MNKTLSFAMLSIAICAISTGAFGQKVYKCGSTYSQIPCGDSTTLETGDARSKAQKAETEKAVNREAKAANAMEKARVKEEEQLAAQQKSTAKAEETAAKKVATAKAKADAEEEALKKAKKKKEPEFFTAKSADEKKK
jgi:preprotein translocase subunit SecF